MITPSLLLSGEKSNFYELELLPIYISYFRSVKNAVFPTEKKFLSRPILKGYVRFEEDVIQGWYNWHGPPHQMILHALQTLLHL